MKKVDPYCIVNNKYRKSSYLANGLKKIKNKVDTPGVDDFDKLI